ncbi:MAG: hypothetical protein AABY22_28300, partial [Nanoarchaeota archaeon]
IIWVMNDITFIFLLFFLLLFAGMTYSFINDNYAKIIYVEIPYDNFAVLNNSENYFNDTEYSGYS